jgi:exportin-1
MYIIQILCVCTASTFSAGIQREERYAGQYVLMFSWTMEQLKQMLPLPVTPLAEKDVEGHGVYYIKQCYKTGAPQDQNFIQHLALFLCTFLKDHGSLIEDKVQVSSLDYAPELQEHLMNAMVYLIQISHVDYREIFKICLEYWNFLTADLYRENPIPWASRGLLLGESGTSPRRAMYREVLSELRKIMIQKMAKPEEVIVVENEQGEAVRETMKDTDAMILYKSMRETLVYLTHLDCEDTERIMTEKLFKQVDGSEWSWSNLNKLCWAIGSISGAMTEEDEKRFLVLTIKELLGLVEMKKGKDNKAIIASDIMYIVGQYPRFLRAHWKFLKTVVNKLFEFMHETHDGVQDMACDTFIKIAQKCKRHFVVVQTTEINPFIDQILMNVTSVICDLQHHQVHTFYEAIGHLVSAQMNSPVQQKLVEKMMTVPNQIWDSIITKAADDPSVLQDEGLIRELGHILKINVRGCSAIGHPFVVQLGHVYMDMLNLYKCLSENISTAVGLSGEMVMKQPLISSMRTVKKETLKFITCWVSQCQEPLLVREQFMPPLWEAILADYARNVPDAREPEVLSTTTTIIEKLMDAVVDDIPKVFEALFECTFHMISKDGEEYPEHRRNFYKMLQATTVHCFPALIRMSNNQFKMILNSVVLGLKHGLRDVSEIALSIVYSIVKSVLNYPDVSQGFFQLYFMPIVEEIFAVVSEASHTSSLTMHATILSFMFSIIEEDGKVTVCLSGQPLPEGSITEQNKAFVQSHLAVLLKQAFPHLGDTLIKVFVTGLFDLNKDLQLFKDHLRDFLIQLKEYTGGDITDLYLEEKEEQLKKAALEKRKAQESVPGIINPYDRTDDAQDMQ